MHCQGMVHGDLKGVRFDSQGCSRSFMYSTDGLLLSSQTSSLIMLVTLAWQTSVCLRSYRTAQVAYPQVQLSTEALTDG